MTEKKTKKKREGSSAEPVVSAKGRVDYTKPDPKSGKLRPYGGTGEGNPDHAHLPPEAFCTANRAKDGKPCRKLKVTGAEVCGTHGGRAPQVMRKAMARLQNNADRLAQALVDIATDEEVSEIVRLRAIDSALDRAGLKAKDKLDITHEMKPYERVLAGAVRIDRTAPTENDVDPTFKALQQNDDRY